MVISHDMPMMKTGASLGVETARHGGLGKESLGEKMLGKHADFMGKDGEELLILWENRWKQRWFYGDCIS